MNITPIIIHRYVVPVLHTLLWGVGLVFSLFGNRLFSFVTLTAEHEVLSWAFWNVYVIFVFEYLIVVFDQKICHNRAHFKSNVLWMLIRFVFVTIGVVMSWVLYDKVRCDGLSPYLLSMIFFACWQKLEEMSFSNNIEKYLDKGNVNQLQIRAA